MKIAEQQRRAFGLYNFNDQLNEFKALQKELNRKCQEPSEALALKCALDKFDTCVASSKGTKSSSIRSCGAMLLAMRDGDSTLVHETFSDLD
jgi:hypothetical protein